MKFPTKESKTNCIKFEFGNLHPHTLSTSILSRYSFYVALVYVFIVWLVKMTAYGIAKLLQTLKNPDTKRCHSFITTKTLNYI